MSSNSRILSSDAPAEGAVWLVGAGSMDPELISVKGKKMLEQCDILLYDDLIHPALLDYAPDAQKVYTGKRAGRHSLLQEDITRLMIRLHQENPGACIVRLKGGDPFLFGRGMEEMLGLEKAGVPVYEIPGIPSAIAVPAASHMPLTHRGMAGSVTFVTGHTREGSFSAEKLETLASLQGTLVVFMGLGSLDAFCAGLILAGKDPETPAAILSTPDLMHTKIIRAALRNLPAAAQKEHAESPALIVIGDVTTLLKDPNPALHLGICGSKDFGRRLEQSLNNLGITASLEYLLEESYEDARHADWIDTLEDPYARPDWIVLFSRHGARLFIRQLRENKMDLRKLGGIRIACIGKATAHVLEEAGIYPDFISRPSNSRALAYSLCTLAKEQNVLLLRSEQADNEVMQILRDHVRSVRQMPFYSITWKPVSRKTEDLDGVVFGSRSALQALQETGLELPGDLPRFFLSDHSADAACRISGTPIHVAQDAHSEELAETIASVFRKQN